MCINNFKVIDYKTELIVEICYEQTYIVNRLYFSYVIGNISSLDNFNNV